MAKYTYSIANDITLGAVDSGKLTVDIQASSTLTIALDYISTSGDVLDIYFKAELSLEEVAELDAIVAAHVPTPLPPDATLVTLDEVKDDANRLYIRQVVTKPDFYYKPRSLDFYTSRYNSLYNRKHFSDPSNLLTGGTIEGAIDHNDGLLQFFDATNTELVKGEEESAEDFQLRLTASCTKTVLIFEPTFTYDIFGAKLHFLVPQSLGETDRAYFWVVLAPDIPEAYGGNVVFMGGGMNMAFFRANHFECDGKTVARIAYDPVYRSGKMAVITKHNPGIQIGIQLILQFYSN